MVEGLRRGLRRRSRLQGHSNCLPGQPSESKTREPVLGLGSQAQGLEQTRSPLTCAVTPYYLHLTDAEAARLKQEK